MKYSKAMERLEQIIQKIENDQIDIDELSENVKEAVGLVRLCKDKIEKAELDVKEIVQKFESSTEK